MSVEFPFTHDISRLLSMLEDVPTDVSEHWHLIELNVFAVRARYESGLVGDEQSIDRSTMIDDVERLLLHVEQIVASI